MRSANKLYFFLVIAFAFATSPVRAELVYGVGNSLTIDLLGSSGFDSVTANAMNPSLSQFHVRCGSSLTATLAKPNDVCVTPGSLGVFTNALPSNLNSVFLQPFYGASIRDEINSVKTFVDLVRSNPANNDTRIFIYATWSENTALAPFLDTWNTHSASLS